MLEVQVLERQSFNFRIYITKRLSGIHAAWHFWYAVGFGGKSGLRKLGLCGIHPLTRR
ncbi:DUF3265 domain-containing protein [Vibrio vulnificus]|nr:DUF3265 domain-containing protein [Vibrio vulnificus]ELP4436353.1 DUF3265 domain-containing protein [Vibrio vulnificus]